MEEINWKVKYKVLPEIFDKQFILELLYDKYKDFNQMFSKYWKKHVMYHNGRSDKGCSLNPYLEIKPVNYDKINRKLQFSCQIIGYRRGSQCMGYAGKIFTILPECYQNWNQIYHSKYGKSFNSNTLNLLYYLKAFEKNIHCVK